MSSTKFGHRFQHLPVAFTGLALGVGGFGNALMNIFQYTGGHGATNDASWITIISVSILSIFLLIMLMKNILHPKVLHYELHDPLAVSLIPTFSMALMIVAGFIGMWDKSSMVNPCQISATVIMLLAILLQFIVIGYFIKSFVKHHIHSNEHNMYGTYFVPIVGLVTACTVQGNFTLLPNKFFQAIWYLGWGTFILSLPIVTYSLLFKEKKVSDAQFPTVAVWFAPANLTASGFVQTFLLGGKFNGATPDYYPQGFLIAILFITVMMGFMTTLILYLYVVRIFSLQIKNKQNGFSPILCSLSFPLAIGTTAMIFTSKYFANLSISTSVQIFSEHFFEAAAWFFFIASCVFAVVTASILFYLIFNMFKFAYQILFTKNKDEQHHIVYKKK